MFTYKKPQKYMIILVGLGLILSLGLVHGFQNTSPIRSFGRNHQDTNSNTSGVEATIEITQFLASSKGCELDRACDVLVNLETSASQNIFHVELYATTPTKNNLIVMREEAKSVQEPQVYGQNLPLEGAGFYNIKALALDEKNAIVAIDHSSFYVGTKSSSKSMQIVLATSELNSFTQDLPESADTFEIFTPDQNLQGDPGEELAQEKVAAVIPKQVQQVQLPTTPSTLQNKASTTNQSAPQPAAVPKKSQKTIIRNGVELNYGIPDPVRQPLKVNFGQYGYNSWNAYHDPGYEYNYRGTWSFGWSKVMIPLTVQGNPAINIYGKNPTNSGYAQIGKDSSANWKVKVLNGRYSVRVSAGSTTFSNSNDLQNILANGQTVLNCNQTCDKTININVTNGEIKLQTNGSAPQTKLNVVEINPV